MSWIDQSAEGEVLEWRPHFLSSEMRFLDKPYLAFEPTWRDPKTLSEFLLDLTMTPDGLKWTWGAWSRIKLKFYVSDGFLDLGPARERWLPAQTYQLSWQDLPPCDAFELTPQDSRGVSGATVRAVRPATQPWIPFDFRYVNELQSGIRIVPKRPDWLDRMEISAVGLVQVHHQKFRRTTATGLSTGGGFLRLPGRFEGLVAVYGSIGKRRRLLDCTTVFRLDERGRPQSLEEWRQARELVSSGDREVPPWPSTSADPLNKILKEAQAAGIPSDQLDPRNARGLHRFLVLRACRLPVAAKQARNLGALAREPELSVWLRNLTSPELLGMLERSVTTAGRLWLLGNARHPHLSEIFEWAGRDGSSGLDLAKGLISFRHNLRLLAGEVREDCPEGKEIKALRNEVDKAPSNLLRPRDLEARVAKLEERVKASRERHPAPLDKPPITVKEHAAWQEARRQAWTWRAWADNALTYCEAGEWKKTGAKNEDLAEIDLRRLAARARALPAPIELHRGDQDAAEARRLSSLLEELFGHQDWEPASADKEAILRHLETLVRPDPGRWAAMHGVLRSAAELAKRWPRLAQEFGAEARESKALGERARWAQALIDLEEDLRTVARSWRQEIVRVVPDRKPEVFLATPGHPAIERTYRECVSLAQRLDREMDLPKAPPLAPATPTAQDFRRWWRQLEELFAALRLLRDAQTDLDGKVRWVREELLPRAKGYLQQYSALPADRRPPDLDILEATAHELAESNGVVTRKAYMRFTEAFDRVERFHGSR